MSKDLIPAIDAIFRRGGFRDNLAHFTGILGSKPALPVFSHSPNIPLGYIYNPSTITLSARLSTGRVLY